ncbi:MAG: 4-hydroxy-tetrahydrodipicolinate synthase [Actinobacteria bacterium]|nr:4-hydroxy-tetrahydrodipicolinate synthase [Actinomycetota bacterium]
MAGRFGTVVPAMVTPFDGEGALDLERAAQLARWLVEHGSDGLVIHGSTGEGATMDDGEKFDLVRAVKEAVGDTPVVAGTGTYDTRHTIHLGERAKEAGADGLLVVTPYYVKPSQRGLLAHYRAVAEGTDLPVLIYNIPGRSVIRIEHDTLLELAQVENIVGVKDATGDVDGAARLIAEAPSGFEVYAGDDWGAFTWACVGAVGVISVAAHVAGERFRRMFDLIASGDVPAALKLHRELLPLYSALFVTSNPTPVKAALEMIGQPVGEPRLPLIPANDEERAVVRRALEASGVS